MGDMEEELNTVRAQSRTQTNLIRMKEEQILKYKSGLEKAKSRQLCFVLLSKKKLHFFVFLAPDKDLKVLSLCFFHEASSRIWYTAHNKK